jgi:hypothetical protein
VVNDEGLHSYKAIMFIKSNPKYARLNAKSHFILGAFLQKIVFAKQEAFSRVSNSLGEKLWIK